MSLHDFVFSEQRSIRLRRHATFWIAWCIYLAVTYLIPTNWIPGWNFNAPARHIQAYGPFLAPLRILMAAVLLSVVHMLLVYGILYLILPRYYSKNKSWLATIGLSILLVCVVAFINYFNFLLSFRISKQTGYFPSMPQIDFIAPVWGRQILFNYPTLIGFAVGIKLMKNWYQKQKEAAQVAREKIHAELQLLKAQVHPHFLFNTLNNIYSFIIYDSPAAPEVLQKLSSLLHYMVYDCSKPFVNLEDELKMLKGYIDLEKIRYGKNFNLNTQINGDPSQKMISPLFLIPFLENSFKHGASQMLIHPWIKMEIFVASDLLYFNLSNSKPVTSADANGSKGLGLNNVKKRLAILYPNAHSLQLNEDDMSYSVFLQMPIYSTQQNWEILKTEFPAYELA